MRCRATDGEAAVNIGVDELRKLTPAETENQCVPAPVELFVTEDFTVLPLSIE